MAEIALIANLAAFVAFLLSRRFEATYRIGVAILWASTVALVGLVVYRSVAIAFPALTGTYEGLVVLALAMNATLALGHRRLFDANRSVLAWASFTAFIYLAILSSPIVSSELFPPVPILRSYWLVLHVAFAFVGLALFTLAMVVSVVASFAKEARALDQSRDAAVSIGFAFYAVGGLVFGAIWAENAWGRFWGWDPKETWALITTLVYSVYIHLRFVRRRRALQQKWARALAIVAWCLAIFTFWGVNYLMTGLHSYV